MELMREFLAEMESLIEEDDGLVFQLQHIEMLDELVDLMEEYTDE
jgi:hypothetical protein